MASWKRSSLARIAALGSMAASVGMTSAACSGSSPDSSPAGDGGASGGDGASTSDGGGGAGDDGGEGGGADAGITRTKDCAPSPHACGFPDETNTGVPSGVTLKRVPEDVTSGAGWHWEAQYGDLRVDTDGAVVEGFDIHGNIEVYANKVTIKSCRITVTGDTWGIGLRHASDATIDGVEISSPTEDGPDRLEVGIKDIYGDTTGTTIRRANIYHASTGIQLCNGLIEDDYVHDMGLNAGDHINGFTSNAGCDSLVVRHGTFFNQRDQTDAISLFQDFGIQKNAIIDHNLVAGGGYSIYGGGDGQFGVSSNIQITGNRVAKLYSPNGGGFGWLAHYDEQGTGNVLSGNVWDVDDTPVP